MANEEPVHPSVDLTNLETDNYFLISFGFYRKLPWIPPYEEIEEFSMSVFKFNETLSLNIFCGCGNPECDWNCACGDNICDPDCECGSSNCDTINWTRISKNKWIPEWLASDYPHKSKNSRVKAIFMDETLEPPACIPKVDCKPKIAVIYEAIPCHKANTDECEADDGLVKIRARIFDFPLSCGRWVGSEAFDINQLSTNTPGYNVDYNFPPLLPSIAEISSNKLSAVWKKLDVSSKKYNIMHKEFYINETPASILEDYVSDSLVDAQSVPEISRINNSADYAIVWDTGIEQSRVVLSKLFKTQSNGIYIKSGLTPISSSPDTIQNNAYISFPFVFWNGDDKGAPSIKGIKYPLIELSSDYALVDENKEITAILPECIPITIVEIGDLPASNILQQDCQIKFLTPKRDSQEKKTGFFDIKFYTIENNTTKLYALLKNRFTYFQNNQQVLISHAEGTTSGFTPLTVKKIGLFSKATGEIKVEIGGVSIPYIKIDENTLICQTPMHLQSDTWLIIKEIWTSGAINEIGRTAYRFANLAFVSQESKLSVIDSEKGQLLDLDPFMPGIQGEIIDNIGLSAEGKITTTAKEFGRYLIFISDNNKLARLDTGRNQITDILKIGLQPQNIRFNSIALGKAEDGDILIVATSEALIGYVPWLIIIKVDPLSFNVRSNSDLQLIPIQTAGVYGEAKNIEIVDFNYPGVNKYYAFVSICSCDVNYECTIEIDAIDLKEEPPVFYGPYYNSNSLKRSCPANSGMTITFSSTGSPFKTLFLDLVSEGEAGVNQLSCIPISDLPPASVCPDENKLNIPDSINLADVDFAKSPDGIRYALISDLDGHKIYAVKIIDTDKTMHKIIPLEINQRPIQIVARRNGDHHDFAFTANMEGNSVSRIRIKQLDIDKDIPVSSAAIRVSVADAVTISALVSKLEEMIKEAEENKFEISKKQALLNQSKAIYEVLKSTDNPQPILSLLNNLKIKINNWVIDDSLKENLLLQTESAIASIENI